VEAELIAGGVYLDCTWTFVLQPVGAGRTRLLVRTRGNYAPWLLGLVVPALGLYDASYGVAQLRAITRRAEALATTCQLQRPEHRSDRPQGRRNE
jgi:hypothetical protein